MPLRGRRINMFARNLYRYGLLGRFIGVLHAVAKLHGKKLRADSLGAHAGRTARACSSATSRRCSTTSRSRMLSQKPGILLRARHSAGAI